ncbi:hypothetical protein NDI45_15045 [Leptolyngbya sp. GB1-A1]|uniref:hypothetical protein n=1 Tax=Leptolyngbya sp. GB1-A1 TaxID=2933908 RepID=UPI003299005D
MHQSAIRSHLLFYGGMITSVFILFRLTAAYGEARLQAPPNIDGIYFSSIAPPSCPNDSRLRLTVQQSGIYLNGSVDLVQANVSPEMPDSTSSEKLPLTGRWNQEAMALSGNTDALAACQPSSNSVLIKGTIAPNDQLTASLQSGDTPAWSFTADRQERSQTQEH